MSDPKSGGGGGSAPWTQLSGHPGNFRPGSRPGRVLKRLCQTEADCLQAIGRESALRPFAPVFHAVVAGHPDDGLDYLEMQDLLAEFRQPPISLMDCKIGCRTFLEDELESARRDAKPRPDMFRRMSETDPDAPTAEQRKAGAVTKLDYMLWRERLSSTSTLSFRIDGLKCAQMSQAQAPAACEDLKRLRDRGNVLEAMRHFAVADGGPGVAKAYLERLLAIREALIGSEFFPGHELIGSSLLFAHDSAGQASVWMIDFGKTRPSQRPLSHSAEWTEGNHEDGYLIGLDNLIALFRDLVTQ